MDEVDLQEDEEEHHGAEAPQAVEAAGGVEEEANLVSRAEQRPS